MNIEKLNNLAISDSGFIFDPATGNSYTTNETGLLILNTIRKGENPSFISDLLTEEYDVSKEEAEHDVMNILEQLRSNNLI